MNGMDNSFLEAEYHCRKGYRLKKRTNNNKDMNHNYHNRSSTNLICKNGKWIGRRPICILQKDKSMKNRKNQFKCSKSNKCNQSCLLINGNELCTCYKGFRMNGNRCVGKYRLKTYNLIAFPFN